jgi:predicted RecB family nuclease
VEGSADIESLILKCMARSSHHEPLTARTVASCLDSPYSVYCEKFVDKEEKDEISEYDQLLFKKGNDHETNVVREKYPDAVSVSFESPEIGFRSTVKSMVSGDDILHAMPMYYLPNGVYGIPDMLEKSDAGGSVFGDYHYTVTEVKVAKNIKKSHLIQGAFYNYLLGAIQGTTPKTFFIIDGNGEKNEHDYLEYEPTLMELIGNARDILNGEQVSPTYNSCKFPWKSYCDKKAIEASDISLVDKLGARAKSQLYENYKTVEDISRAKILDLTSVDGVGNKTAINYINSAKAIHSKTHIIIDKDKIEFPQRRMEIFLDLEGIDPTSVEEGFEQIDYMIGILVRENSVERYTAFTANDTNHEEEMLLEFLEFLKKQDDYAIYHYHHYEKTHMTKMMKKYEVDDATQNLLLDNLIDIHKVATSSVAFPTIGTGLKKIAPYLGFTWRHKDVNATESIAMYFDYVKDPVANKANFQKIIDYNEDDCIATRVIKDWLASIITPKS